MRENRIMRVKRKTASENEMFTGIQFLARADVQLMFRYESEVV